MTDAADHDTQSGRPRRWIVLGVVAGVLVVAFIAYRLALQHAVDVRVEALREAGYPTSTAEMNAWLPPVDDGENAVDAYEEAFARLVEPDDPSLAQYEEQLPYVSAPVPSPGEMPPAMKEAIAAYLGANREALERLHGAAGIRSSQLYDPRSSWPPIPTTRSTASRSATRSSPAASSSTASDPTASTRRAAATISRSPSSAAPEIREKRRAAPGLHLIKERTPIDRAAPAVDRDA